MKLEELNPYVRFFKKIARGQIYKSAVCAYDFRLFYLYKGGITFELEKARHRLEGGDVILIPPGTAYKLVYDTPQEIGYYLVNFDFVFDPLYRSSHTPAPSECFDQKQIFSNEWIEPFGEIFVLQSCRSIERVLEEMNESNVTDGKEQAVLGSALMKSVLMKIVLKSKADEGEAASLIREVKDYIEKNSTRRLTNQEVAGHFGYHPYYLSHVFAKAEGKTLHQYINEMRVKAAKERLCLTEQPIAVIAEELGFADCPYFSYFFKKATGMTPKEYRELCK